MPSSPPQAPLTRGLTLLFTFNCGFFSWPILLQKVYLGCTLNSRGGPTRQQYERHRKQASLSSEGWPGRYLAQAHTSGWVASRPQEAPSGGTLHTPAPLCPDWTRKDSLKETLRQCRWLPNTPPPRKKPWVGRFWTFTLRPLGLGREALGRIRHLESHWNWVG